MTKHVLISLLAAGFLSINSYWMVQISSANAAILNSQLAIKAIESDRFRQKDGLAIWKEIARIQQQVAVTGAQLDMHLKIPR